MNFYFQVFGQQHRFVTLSIRIESVTKRGQGGRKVSPWVCGGLEKCRRGFVWVSKSVAVGCGSFDPFEKCHNEVHDVSEYSGASGRGKLPTVGRMGAAGALLIAAPCRSSDAAGMCSDRIRLPPWPRRLSSAVDSRGYSGGPRCRQNQHVSGTRGMKDMYGNAWGK